MNIRFAGFGGQGIIMAGYALGHAGVLDGRNALQTQSYGSESRGGTCKSDVIIAEGEITELAPAAVDVLIVMSRPAFDRFLPQLNEAGLLIYDSDLVDPGERLTGPGRTGTRAVGLPVTQMAHTMFGRDVVANVIMLGVLVGLTGIVSRDAIRRAIAESVPPKTVDMNLQAFEEGFKRGIDRSKDTAFSPDACVST